MILFSLNYQRISSFASAIRFPNEPYYQSISESVYNIKQLRARTNAFQSYYFPDCTKEWFKLSEGISFHGITTNITYVINCRICTKTMTPNRDLTRRNRRIYQQDSILHSMKKLSSKKFLIRKG